MTFRHKNTRIIDICLACWPSAIVVALILYATLAPSPVGADELPPIPGLDKIIHAVLGGALAAAVIFDCTRWHRRIPAPATVWMIALASMAFMAVDEVAQSLLGMGRTTDYLDLLADWAGTLIVAGFTPIFAKFCK